MVKWLDIILPALIIIVCTVLLILNIDGEVKGILGMAALWIFRTSVSRSVIDKFTNELSGRRGNGSRERREGREPE